MFVLLTNDDGFSSPLLHALAAALHRQGHRLAVAAPATEQSWIGAAKSRHRPVSVTPTPFPFTKWAWSIDGTPSDCVNLALHHLLPEPPQAVISGINVGLNASLSFLPASGTVAGAWEGVAHGLPGFALSLDLSLADFNELKAASSLPRSLEATVEAAALTFAARAQTLIDQTPPRSFLLHNINFPSPCTAATPWRHTVPAPVLVPSLFRQVSPDAPFVFQFALGTDLPLPADTPPSDRQALRAGSISHSVLDYRALARRSPLP